MDDSPPPALRQMLSDHHQIDAQGNLYRCPCGETFDAGEYETCPSCSFPVPEQASVARDEPGETCSTNMSSPAAGKRSSGGASGHRLHLEEAMAVKETETRIRSGVYAAANPEAVRDRASFLAFVAALVRDAHRTPAPNRTAEEFLAMAGQWADETKALADAAGWKEFARFLKAGMSAGK